MSSTVTGFHGQTSHLADALAGIPDGFVMFDASDRLLAFNQRWIDFFPRSRDLRVPGVEAAEMWRQAAVRGDYKGVGSEQVDGWLAWKLSAYQSGGTPEIELADGRWIETRVARSPQGSRTAIVRDISSRKRRERDLEAQERDLQAGLNSLGAWLLCDARGRVIRSSSDFQDRSSPADEANADLPAGTWHELARRHFGERDAATPLGSWLAARAADPRSLDPEQIDLVDGRRLQFQRLRSSGSAMLTVRKLTGAALSERHHKLILHEMAHRGRNLLSIVQVLAGQTARRAPTVAAFIEAFESRLRALATANALLVDEGTGSANLADLVSRVLLPFMDADGQQPVELDLADGLLPPTLAQGLALALHELATNATKYGAWSSPGGKVVLSGGVRGRRLELDWHEQGGPAVDRREPNGFGMLLLEQVLGQQHHGRVDFDWRSTGLVCRIALPIAAS